MQTQNDIAKAAETLPLYKIFGFKMASEFPFANRMTTASGDPDVTFHCVNAPPIAGDWQKVEPCLASPRITEEGESRFSIHRLEEYDVIHFAGIADFYLWPDRIVSHLLDPAYDYLVEIRLLGEVFTIWLELHDLPALHASAIVESDKAAAFLSTNKGGKSVLAASLMQEGRPLLTDDILAVEESQNTFLGRPSYPQMRMWPGEAMHFLGHYQDLEIVHPGYTKRRVPVGPDGLGAFCSESRPLSALYLPKRLASTEGKIKIETVSPRDAIIELIRNSFSSRIVEALGLGAKRLEFFARLARQVPMHRIESIRLSAPESCA
jgi:hypothetical protein